MLEDALKTTRTLHRLIISVSIATLVFSLSLRLPQDAKAQYALISALLEFPFGNYESFVAEKVDDATSQLLTPIAESIRTNLASTNYFVFGIGEIADVFAQPIHIGKIDVGKTVLSHLSNSTLNQLRVIPAALHTTNDVQMLLPDVNDLLPRIHEFLREQGRTGARVDNVRLELPNFDFLAETFLPMDSVTCEIYFELRNSDRPAAPVFTGPFNARVTTISNTSWELWLASQPGVSEIARRSGAEFQWLPGLGVVPRGFTEKKFGVLISELSDEIKRGSPESQSVSLLGTNVPGLLLIYAVPLVLLGLTYYFLNHVNHLFRMASSNTETFRQFAWLPLSLDTGWRFESVFSLVVLPALSLFAMGLQLHRFGYLKTGPLVFMIVASLAICVLARLSVLKLGALRMIVQTSQSPAKPPTPTIVPELALPVQSQTHNKAKKRK